MIAVNHTMLQILTTRFKPYISAKADTLDITTQSVSLLSILLAQYMHATEIINEGSTARKVSTVLFVGLNLLLILVHFRLIVTPLAAKLRAVLGQITNIVKQKHPVEPNNLENEGEANDHDTEANCKFVEFSVSPIAAIVKFDDRKHQKSHVNQS